MNIDSVDICCGLNWGDEAKGKIIAQLSKSKKYNFVCRWNGGNNAGHTVYVNGIQYKTHLIPCGIFYNIPSIIGPDCVINLQGFQEEINYLENNGFNTNLIKISPKAHLITNEHIDEDIRKYKSQGTTSKGIAPCYRDKYARKGIQIKNVDFFNKYLWDEKLFGNVLCEGAQGFWLDINQGNYPFTTSSTTLPYGACSLGFPTNLINKIYGATKIYDTRSGTDPDFPEELLDNPELLLIIKEGKEFGTTTGRMRKVNWLDLDKLIHAINTTGTTDIIISKVDVLEKVNLFKLISNKRLLFFNSIDSMKENINKDLTHNCKYLKNIIYSDNVEFIKGIY